LGEMKIEQTTKIIEIIDRDLRKIFNVLSEKMNKEGISRDLLENAVKKLSEYNEKVKQLEKEIKSTDSEVMKIYGYVNEIKKLLS
jgi:peptidoglycan hydrolase CwlO-like protein